MRLPAVAGQQPRARRGVDPESIDSGPHGDHVGGHTIPRGDAVALAFPRACYVASRDAGRVDFLDAFENSGSPFVLAPLSPLRSVQLDIDLPVGRDGLQFV